MPPLPQMDAWSILASGLTAAIIAYMIFVAVADYTRMRISNRSVLVGIALYALWALFATQSDPLTDLLVGGLLFALGFGFWMFRVAGAGDAKFMFVCGTLAGFSHLPHFALSLVVVSLVLFIGLKIAARPAIYPLIVVSRLGTIVDTGRVPYGVVLSVATTFAFLMRMTSSFAL